MPIPPKPPWYSTPTAIESLTTTVPNCNSLIESPTDARPATENYKNTSYDNIENKIKNNNNDRPDDDDGDVDCFPRQDKQPVPPQDISPTDTLPSLIESITDKSTDSTDTDNNNNNNRWRTSSARTKQSVYQGSQTKPIYDVACFHQHDKQPTYDDDDDEDTYGDYAYDAYDEYDDLAYDDDDDNDSYASSSSDEDYYTHANVIIDMYGNIFTTDDNDDMPMTIKAAQRQINALLAGRTTASSITAFTKQAKRKHDEFFLPKTAARTVPAYANDAQDAFLYHRWNRSNRNKNTTAISPTATTGKTTAYAPIKIPVKDDSSVTPTVETLCTLATCSLDPTYNDTDDAILNITIWNHPIVQYQMPARPFTTTRNRSREHPNTAVQFALIGVYDKLLHPSKSPCLLSFFTSIISVALSCFILLAESFTMVKIDDRYPDEWNE